jgi:hypothetical protein
MPRERGLGLDHSNRIENRGEKSVEPDQDQTIEVFGAAAVTGPCGLSTVIL